MKIIKAIRGMNDILAEDAKIMSYINQACEKVFRSYHYQHIQTPIVEKTELFARSIGVDTDIVAKEMYTFEDRNGDSLTLRPEGTACCVRAGIENGLFYNQQQRLWYSGPMFRHERPQKGRYRQFHQIGAESYGWATPDIDAELISITQHVWEELGLADIELQINSLGSALARTEYRSALLEYLTKFKDQLDEDSLRRFDTNPLRILDSKSPQTQQILDDAPILSDYLDDESKDDFEELQAFLNAQNIPYTVNPKLVRGLDYYNKTVFEWVYPNLGAQATVCAGGRYDGLVEQLGGKPTYGVGFAMGVERLVELLKEQELVQIEKKPEIYFISIGQSARITALKLANELRKSGKIVQFHCGEGAIKNQIKRADKSGASIALILAENEVIDQQITIKPLLTRGEQHSIPQSKLLSSIDTLLKA